MIDYSWDRLRGLGFDLDFIERTLPKNYKKGLTSKEQQIAKREAKETMAKAEDKSSSAKDLYEDWESDNKFKSRNKKIPKSPSTKAFEDRYAEGSSSALAAKSEKSGISLSILRQVYSRGMAAWRSGHRPGVAPQQWALARVNSFITGVGGARKADKDLWNKHKGKNSSNKK